MRERLPASFTDGSAWGDDHYFVGSYDARYVQRGTPRSVRGSLGYRW
jgi:hypothetical protein